MSFTIKDKTLFISHTEHSGLRYQNITKTKEKVPSCFSRMPQNKEGNTNNKNTIGKATKSCTTRNTL